MMRTMALVLAVLSAALSTPAAERPFVVAAIGREEGEPPALNRFHFTDRLFRDALAPLRLHACTSADDRAHLTRALYDGLRENRAMEIRITVIRPVNLVLRFRPLRVKERNSVIMYINYDAERQVLLAADVDPDDWYARAYFVIGGNLVPAARCLPPDQALALVKRLTKDKKFTELASWLLFDDDPANDGQIPDIVARGRAARKSPGDQAELSLVMAQYHLSRGDDEAARRLMDEAAAQAAVVTDGQARQAIEGALGLLREIAAVMRMLP